MYTFKVYLLSLYTDVQSILPSLRLSNRTCIYMVSAFTLLSYEEEVIIKMGSNNFFTVILIIKFKNRDMKEK